jgi:hypothetical protein
MLRGSSRSICVCYNPALSIPLWHTQATLPQQPSGPSLMVTMPLLLCALAQRTQQFDDKSLTVMSSLRVLQMPSTVSNEL